jgi:hypothetical protein
MMCALRLTRDRKACGPVAPPDGLYFMQVDYPDVITDRRKERKHPMTTTIYHNPKCGTSRNTLAMIRQSARSLRSSNT